MDALDARFVEIDKRVASLRVRLERRCTRLEDVLERKFEPDGLIDKINERREAQLNHLDHKLKVIVKNVNLLFNSSDKVTRGVKFRNLFFNTESKVFYVKQFDYLKSKWNTDQIHDLIKLQNLTGTLSLRNEFSVFKKFYYYHLYQNNIVRRKPPAEFNTYQYQCFHLSKETTLVQDLVKKELSLLNKNNCLLKKLTVKSSYSISLFKIINSKIVTILYKNTNQEDFKSKYLCLLDFNLNIIKTKRIDADQLLINFGPNNIFFQQQHHDLNKVKFTLLDLELNEIETIDLDEAWRALINSNRSYLLNVINDRLLIKDFNVNENKDFYNIRIVSKTSGHVIQSIDHLSYFINRINQFFKLDDDMNIYLINTDSDDNDGLNDNNNNNNARAYLFCYDMNGKLRFKRYIPFLNECFYINFITPNLISFNYLNDEVDLL